ncbi:MAG: hypothetical protein GX877_06650 [Bacteroidales bacterium]|nr:hypothetical protein [Bacteroidales bacterium]
MKKNFVIITLFFLALPFYCCADRYGSEVKQVNVERVELMPNMPQPYKIIDWKQKAKGFYDYVFDFNAELPAGTMIWLDDNQRNIPQFTFGLYTAVNDARQGPDKNNGEFHESINSLAAIMGAGLMGINKTNQEGYNYVKMVQNYFNSDNGWNIMMNNTSPQVALLGGGYGRDWWYDLLPNILYYNVCDIFPEVENADNIQKIIAEQFYKADSVLNGNYDYSFFDFSRMQGMRNHIPFQQDAAGGYGYVLYSAYMKFGDARYLERAKCAIQALNDQKESHFYEILLPIGIYTAARLNAEQGTGYDIAKMLDWVFEGNQDSLGRKGWGVIVGKWGRYDVSGLQGSIIDGGGYAFLMNSILMAMPLVPMVKYEPSFARAIGKWMLNNVNACRLFYPDQIADENQWLPDMKELTRSVIAYEGLRYEDCYDDPRLKGVHPVALGDGPNWHPNNPKESMFSLYSTAPVGILGAMTDTTDVPGILKHDCNVTDFYSYPSHPVFLLYNPYDQDRKVTYKISGQKADLFDIVSARYLATNVEDHALITIAADQACLIVELPVGNRIKKKNIYKK